MSDNETARAVVSGRLEAFSASCARVRANLGGFDFDKKRVAFEALGVRVVASGTNPDKWRIGGTTPIEAEGDAGASSRTCSRLGHSAITWELGQAAD